MYKLLLTILISISIVSCSNTKDNVYSEFAKYKAKGKHGGLDVTPTKAYEMVQANPENHFLIDVRTRAEYEFIGHYNNAYNIPLKFFTNELGKKGYKKLANNSFCSDLKKKFDPEKDKLFFICRSGKRTIKASLKAIQCGFKAENVHNIMGGFEGDKIKDNNHEKYGQRLINGWKNEGLPWTYKIEKKYSYNP